MKMMVALLSVFALSQSNISGAEKQATLDQILEELISLKGKVVAMDERLARVERAVASNESAPTGIAQFANGNPPPAETKDKWYENLRVELRKADIRASGDWVKPESWDNLELKMKPEAVVALLGEPTQVKNSLRKDTDKIYIYQGDLDGEGHIVRGEVRIYKGKVSKITPPAF